MNIKAQDFILRQDLDDFVRNELGDDISANRAAGHTIEGTEDELKVLNLSINNRVYGVKVVLTK